MSEPRWHWDDKQITGTPWLTMLRGAAGPGTRDDYRVIRLSLALLMPMKDTTETPEICAHPDWYDLSLTKRRSLANLV